MPHPGLSRMYALLQTVVFFTKKRMEVWKSSRMILLKLILTALLSLVSQTQVQAQCTSGDVRLVGGSNQYEGRVEVCVNNDWGTVCDDFWGGEDATVVCRQLGFAFTGSAEALLNAAFGEGTGNIVLDDVMCLGSETQLLSCPNTATASGNCDHTQDAGVRCEAPCTFDGEIRLAGGNVPYEGRLEVCMSNEWGTVCDDSFSTVDATVVCRELGYSTTDVLFFGSAFFGRGVGPILLDELGCRGTEQSIMECPRASSVRCGSHAEDAGVRCQVENLMGTTCTYGDVRLVDGSNQYEGRVEVCVNDQWGTICNELWSGQDATVICRQLGYGFILNSPALVAPDAMFGRGAGAIVLDDVQCSGNENRILGCRTSPILTTSQNCHHDNDVGVICEVPCTTGQVRLAGGNLPNIGRVEVCIDNEWGTVCDDSFSSTDATVVCQQLGYPTEDAVALGAAFYGLGTGSILLDEVGCTGLELRLTECARASSVSCSQGHREDVGVRCQDNTTGTTCSYGNVRLVGGSNQYEGRVEVCVNDQWGTVCDELWDGPETTVVCRTLGYGYKYNDPAQAIPNAFYGQGTGPIVMDDARCGGNENQLLACPSSQLLSFSSNCGHDDDAGVRCEAPCTTGQIRLVNGNLPHTGRLEVCIDNQWGTVCDDAFSAIDASVVCRQLGYLSEDAVAFGVAFYGAGTGRQLLDEVGCVGTEQRLFDCPRVSSVSCSQGHREDVGVRCQVNSTGTTCSYGDVRLVGGSNQYEGRVEVCVNDQWGTVCDELWDGPETTVVCRTLGYGYIYNDRVQAVPNAFYGRGTGPIVMDDVRCGGNENQLLACPSSQLLSFSSNCDHDDDAGVRCEAPCTTGNIRLVNGNLPHIGRLEVCIDNQWGTVCDDAFSVIDASVVCRQLGYLSEDAVAFGVAFYGAGTGRQLMDEVGCVGTEQRLFDCARASSVSCSQGHREDVGVRCQVISGPNDTTCSYGDVRLVGGSNQYEGRVEVCVNDQWGTVCDELWDGPETTVVCRTLGYGYVYNDVAQAIPNAFYGQGTGLIVMDDVRCGGNENQLLACPSSQLLSFSSNCDHDDDAGVRCEAPCLTGNIRLVNGNLPHIGRLEVCIDNQWGTVCDDAFSAIDASVVCRQLGYLSEDAVAFGVAFYGAGTGRQLLDEIGCVGTEQRLFDCPRASSVSCSQGHREDVGVRCQVNATGDSCSYGEVRLVNGTNPYEGRVEVCVNNTWGTVCDEIWSGGDTTVVCRQLGYSYIYNHDAQAIPNAFYGQGTGPIVMDDVRCGGNENQLLACPSSQLLSFSSNCGHDDDAGVRCEAPCTTGQIRLVNGNLPHIGRLEVCIDKQWGTVCDDAFSAIDASVVCRQLGYLTEDAVAFGVAFYGAGTGRQLLDEVGCVGTEQRLFDCPRASSVSCSQGHREDVGVRCQVNNTGIICSYGQVRLVDGTNAYEGRVEVCINNTWGTVCDEIWSGGDATVVCRQLGYSFVRNDDAQAVPNAFYGRGTGPIVMDDVRCGGNENQLLACPSTELLDITHNCGHDDDAGVTCTAPCRTGELRLRGGVVASEGRVEICMNNEWGTVCDDQFDSVDATVTCRQLGYRSQGAEAVPLAGFGMGRGSIFLDDLRCSGTEQELIECARASSVSCSQGHREDVGVRCEVTCSDGQLRLVGGGLPNEGRVEICISNDWGTVCDNSWTNLDANVVCRQLGFPNQNAVAFLNAHFGAGSGTIHSSEYGCTGSENRLTNCPSSPATCTSHSDDAGVRCQVSAPVGTTCTYGDVRLVGGSNQYEGRVEVCINDQWGTVCDDGWDSTDATVVCNQLGYSYSGSGTAYINAFFGAGTGPVFLSDVQCNTSARELLECPSRPILLNDCSHSADAGVGCQAPCSNGQVRLVGGRTASEGRVELCMNDDWGTVCDSSWDLNDATVVCRQLGHDTQDVVAYSNAEFGAGSGSTYLNFVGCSGTENRLGDCSSTSVACTGQDAGVGCEAITVPTMVTSTVPTGSDQTGPPQPTERDSTATDTSSIPHSTRPSTREPGDTQPTDPGSNPTATPPTSTQCTHGDVRLQGTTKVYEGRLEICMDNVWGSVCDDSWDVLDAMVVCRQLGYSEEDAKAFSNAPYGGGIATTYLNFVDCKGNERSLLACSSNSTPCDTSKENAGVMCQENDTTSERTFVTIIIDYVLIAVVAVLVIVILLLIVVLAICLISRRRKSKKDKEHSLGESDFDTPMTPLQPVYNTYDYGDAATSFKHQNEYAEIPPVLAVEEPQKNGTGTSSKVCDPKGKSEDGPGLKGKHKKGTKATEWKRKSKEDEEVLLGSYPKDEHTSGDTTEGSAGTKTDFNKNEAENTKEEQKSVGNEEDQKADTKLDQVKKDADIPAQEPGLEKKPPKKDHAGEPLAADSKGKKKKGSKFSGWRKKHKKEPTSFDLKEEHESPTETQMPPSKAAEDKSLVDVLASVSKTELCKDECRSAQPVLPLLSLEGQDKEKEVVASSGSKGEVEAHTESPASASGLKDGSESTAGVSESGGLKEEDKKKSEPVPGLKKEIPLSHI